MTVQFTRAYRIVIEPPGLHDLGEAVKLFYITADDSVLAEGG